MPSPHPASVATAFTIAVLPGDGIGPEVVAASLEVLRATTALLSGVDFSFETHAVGAGEYLQHGDPLPATALAAMRRADAMALFLVQRPQAFDVLVTENMFGDILSDLGAGLVGGMGMAPSADLGDEHGLFQPSHGTAPTIAGQGIANPIATILSVAMLLDWLDHPETRRGARVIERAVATVLANPANRTKDLGGTMGTEAMTSLVVAAIQRSLS